MFSTMGRYLKICSFITTFTLLTGFLPGLSLIGPGITVLTSGNIYKAGSQYLLEKTVQKKTGKNSLSLVREKIEKKNLNNEFHQKFKILVEKRVLETRAKLNLQNINQ